MPNKNTKQHLSAQAVDDKGNYRSSDYIIGDVHGSLTLLKEVIKKLAPDDRLFIVGDLIDRGEDSVGVIETIIEHNKNNNNQIYCVQGNHERDFLKVCPILTELCQVGKSVKDLEPEKKKALGYFLANGGEWIIQDDFKNTKYCQNILKNLPIALDRGLDFDLTDFSDKLNKDLLANKIATMRDYIQTLPIAIVVGEENDPGEFVVLHADKPVLDMNLRNKDYNLSNDDIVYMTTARDFKDITNDSLLAYVGHNDIEISKKDKYESFYRKKTRTFNLDFGACFDDCIFLVNHTKGAVEVISKKNVPEKTNQNAKNIKDYIYNVFCKNNPLRWNAEISGLLQRDSSIDEIHTNLLRISGCNENSNKDNYLQCLKILLPKLNKNQKEDFAKYLLESPNHLLKKEQDPHYRCNEYSNETRSMHKAIRMLLNSSSNQNTESSISNITLDFKNKIAEIKVGGKSYKLKRHPKEFEPPKPTS